MGLIAIPKRRQIFKLMGVPQIDWDDPLTRSLVGFWGMFPYEFGGKVIHDLSGNGAVSTFLGNASWGTNKRGPTLTFDGVNDLVLITLNSILEQTFEGQSITLVAGVKSDSVASEYAICGRGRGTSDVGMMLAATSGQFMLRTVTGGMVTSFDPSSFTIGQYYDIAGTYDGTTQKLYVDGVLVDSDAQTGNLVDLAASYPVVLGGGYNGSIVRNDFPGDISYFYIYNRPLFTSEIILIHQEPSRFIISPRKRAMWIFKAVEGETYIRTIDDDCGIIDSETVVKTFSRTLTESVGVTDIASKASTSVRILAEALGITDATVKDETKTLAEALGITDITSRDVTQQRTIAESLGLTDTTVRVFVILRTFAESLGIADVTTKISVLSRVLSEALGITDVMTKMQAQLRTVADSLGITDETLKVQAQLRVISEALGLTDLMQIGNLITIADAMGITDDVSRLVNYITTQSDDIGIADAIVRVAVALRIVDESLGITDVMSITDLVKAAWAFMIIRQTHN